MKALLLWVLLVISATVVTCSPLFAQGVTNHNPIAQPNVLKPSRLASFNDPKFGTTVTRITDARSSGFPGIVPQYSKRQAWNSDESFMMLLACDGRILLLNGSTYQFIKTIDVGGEDVFWHPTNPSIIYYCPDSNLYSYNVVTDQQSVVRTFAEYSFANTRGEGNLSSDGRYYAFVGMMYSYTTGVITFKDIVVYDIATNTITKKLQLPPVLADFDWVSISPLGNYVVVDYATSDTGRNNGVEVYDRQLNFRWQKPLGAGHSDLGVDGNGDEVLVIDYYDGDLNKSFVKQFRLSDSKETTLLEVSPHFDMHISCRNESLRGWCFISTFDFVSRLTDDSTSWLPFEDEVFALKMDGSGDVMRLAHHHSRRYSPTTPDMDSSVYYAEPHATVSRRAERVLFGSNWRDRVESDSSLDSYVVSFKKSVGIAISKSVPREPALLQNYPNPFNPTTNFRFRISNLEFVTLKIFDVLGREVATLVNEVRPAGVYTVRWDASSLPSGVYLYRLRAGDFVNTKKLLLVK
jgi:hypothetical protein